MNNTGTKFLLIINIAKTVNGVTTTESFNLGNPFPYIYNSVDYTALYLLPSATVEEYNARYVAFINYLNSDPCGDYVGIIYSPTSGSSSNGIIYNDVICLGGTTTTTTAPAGTTTTTTTI